MATDLEHELAELMEVETFPPSDEFRSAASISDDAVREEAERDPAAWWLEQARALDWFAEPSQSLDDSNPPFYKWFADGTLNASVNCLDRHVDAGLGDRVAFHWRGEEGEERDVTYAQLLADVQRFASALKSRGIGGGDVVGIFLPMIPEVVVAMLACARIGAPHNVVFGGFSRGVGAGSAWTSPTRARSSRSTARGARARPRRSRRRSTRSASTSRRSSSCATPASTARWASATSSTTRRSPPPTPSASPSSSTPSIPLYILYSSGSTAKPKGILHTTGGYLTHVAWTHRHVFDLNAESDVYWCSADVGWVTGHSYIVYGPLANGCTSVMYEGAPDYPDKDVWWDLCERYGVTIFYTAPTAIRACMKWGEQYPGRHDLSQLRLLGTSVSRSTRRPGSGTTRSSAASAARSSTRGGRRRPARS